MEVNYDYYRIFYYVAKYGSFTQAANAMFGSQPNLTRAIKNLEESLGCTLFVRTNRAVTLTEEGEKLYNHIAVAVEQILAGEEELLQDKNLQRGVVNLGVSETALRCLLLPTFQRYRSKYPGIRFKIFNFSTPQATEALQSGLVELAVVTTPADLAPNMRSVNVVSFREVGVCSEAFPELAGRKVTLREISTYPMISLSSNTKTYAFYRELFRKNGLTLSPDIEAATVDQIIPLVESDLGVGFVPEPLLERSKSRLVRLDLAEEIPMRSICLIKRTDRPLGLAAEALERMILAAKEGEKREQNSSDLPKKPVL